MCFDVCACSARVRRSPSPVTTPQRRVQRRRAPEQAVEVEAAAAACKTTLLWRGRARPRLCPAGRVSTAWTTRVNLTLTGSAYCHLDEKFEFWFLLIEMQLCDLQPWFQKVGMLSLKTIICAIIFKQRTTLIWIHVVTSFMWFMCFTKWWTSLHPHFWTRNKEGRFHTQSWYQHLSVDLFPCGIFQTGVSEHDTSFPVFSCHCPNLFASKWTYRNIQKSCWGKTLNKMFLYCFPINIKG